MHDEGPQRPSKDDRMWPALLAASLVLLFLAAILGSALLA